MSKKMILLVLIFSLAFIGACSSARPIDPGMKGKIGDTVGTPPVATPIGVDNSKISTPPGKIGDTVGTPPVGTSIGGVDNSQTPAAKGKIGDTVGTPPVPSSLTK